MEGLSIAERIKRRRIETVEVPGLGQVRIGSVSAKQFIQIAAMKDEEQPAELVAACVLDEQDRPLFASAADVKLADLDKARALVDAVKAFNGLKDVPRPQQQAE